MKRVELIWIDIIHDAGWHEESEVAEYVKRNNKVFQVGYIHSESETHLHLVDSYFENMEYLGVIYKIPKGCIIDIKELAYK